MEREFKLIPIHPFTNRQAEVIQIILEGERNHRKIAKRLGIAYNTVVNHINGLDTSAVSADKTLTINDISRAQLGISGIIQILTGRRPGRSILGPLFGDVILETNTNPV